MTLSKLSLEQDLIWYCTALPNHHLLHSIAPVLPSQGTLCDARPARAVGGWHYLTNTLALLLRTCRFCQSSSQTSPVCASSTSHHHGWGSPHAHGRHEIPAHDVSTHTHTSTASVGMRNDITTPVHTVQNPHGREHHETPAHNVHAHATHFVCRSRIQSLSLRPLRQRTHSAASVGMH